MPRMPHAALALAAAVTALIALVIPTAVVAAPVPPPAAAPIDPNSWGYNARLGPGHWADLRADFRACRDGQYQSPVNLHANDVIDPAYNGRHFPDWSMPPFVAGSMEVKNLVHTVEYAAEGESAANTTATHRDEPARGLHIGGTALEFKQFHFHTPSEHRINGVHYAGELHMVHKSADGKRAAVVGFLIDVVDQAENPVFAQLLAHLPTNASAPAVHLEGGMLDTAPFVNAAKGHFFTYSGSLTTPPCTEGVTWLIPASPLKMSVKQLKALQTVIGFSARPTQYNKGVADARKTKDHEDVAPAGAAADGAPSATYGTLEVPTGH
ncbi:hypothetical protein GGF32_005544 [Allomyces javanicus]|nr:hypothetical protein GGF32_005544 [Allomyces javanicus]